MTDASPGWPQHWPDAETLIFHWMLSTNLGEVCSGLGQNYPIEELLRMRSTLDLPERPCGFDSFPG